MNVRVIAATNRNLEKMVAKGEFREDLWFRINICPLSIPPLRERRDEIELILNYFFNEFSVKYKTPPPIMADDLRKFILEDYAYPGNIRELKNIAQYLCMISRGERLSCDDLPSRYLRWYNDGGHYNQKTDNISFVRGEAERKHLTKLLEKHQGDIKSVCKEIGLSRARIYQILKKYSLRPGDFRVNN